MQVILTEEEYLALKKAADIDATVCARVKQYQTDFRNALGKHLMQVKRHPGLFDDTRKTLVNVYDLRAIVAAAEKDCGFE